MLHYLFKGQFHFSMRQMNGSLIFVKWYYHTTTQAYLVQINYMDIHFKTVQKYTISINDPVKRISNFLLTRNRHILRID